MSNFLFTFHRSCTYFHFLMQLLLVKHTYKQLKPQGARCFTSVFFCLYVQQEIQKMLVFQFFDTIFSKPVFYLLTQPQISANTAVISRENTELFGEYIFRSSRSELFNGKGVFKNFAKSVKHLRRSFLFNKFAGWRPAILSRRNPGTGVVLRNLRNY